MPLDHLKAAIDLRMLVQVKLSGLTLYFADRHVSIDDGNWYDGRLKLKGRTQERYHSILEAKQQASTFQLRLDNRDEGLNDYLTDYEWANVEVVVYAGEGSALADYSVVFVGFVKSPGGIKRGEDVTVTLVDAILRDDIATPYLLYTVSDFENLDTRHSDQHRPIVYGIWSESASGSSTLPIDAYCIDISTNLFEVAGHTVGAIEQAYLDGTAVAHSLVSLGPQARFTLTNYTPGASVVTVEAIGKTGLGVNLAATTHMTHPLDILYDYMTNEVGITTTRIDKQSFIDTKLGASTLVARRVIKTHRSSMAYQVELLNEYGYEMHIVGGSYSVANRVTAGTTDLLLRIEDAVSMPEGIYDNEKLYANYIQGFYNYQPRSEVFYNSLVAQSDVSITAVGASVEREMKFYWQYKNTAETRVTNDLYEFDDEREFIIGTFKNKALNVKLGDVVELNLGYWSNIYAHVRELDRNWDTLETTLAMVEVPATVPISATITDPVAGQCVTSTPYTVQGTAVGTFLDSVEVKLNDASWATATGTAAWSHSVGLTFEGSNTVYARAKDTSGDYSAEDSVTFTYETLNDFLTNLNAYWKFEEDPANPNFVDAHSNGYHFDVEYGTGLSSTTGKDNKGINFDDASSMERSNVAGEGFDNISKFSLRLFVKFNSGAGGSNTFLCVWDLNPGSGNYRIFSCHTSTGIDLDMEVGVNGNEGYGVNYVHIDSALSETTWYEIVFVYDGTQSVQADRVKFYVDGSEVTTGKSVTGTIPASLLTAESTIDLEFGAIRAGANNQLDGIADEVAFWSGRALTASEVSDLYNSGSPLFYDDFA